MGEDIDDHFSDDHEEIVDAEEVYLLLNDR